MDLDEKLRILARSARFDLCGDCDVKGNGRVRTEGERWQYPDVMPDGKNSIMMRVLMTNRCENNCFYCENACSRDFPEASISPDDLATHFADLWRTNRARSLFLSSAVQVSSEHTMTRMVETLELIRRKHRIPAYIHTKILPGASDELIVRAVCLSTRVSVNLEVPSRERMARIGDPKDFDGALYGRVRFISKLLEDPDLCGRTMRRRPKTQTTQFVVGAAGETDREILGMSSHLYGDLDLSRIYFSAFQPPGRVDFGAPRAPIRREHRLYQSDFLLRKYGFKADEIPLTPQGDLSLHEDPKTAWARLHPDAFPIEINTAPRSRLLRVPGLGPVSVKRILAARRKGKIRDRDHLAELGVRAAPAMSYLLFNGVSRAPGGGRVQGELGFGEGNEGVVTATPSG